MEQSVDKLGTELGDAAKKPWTIPSKIGEAVGSVTEPIENYTQEGREEHPVLSRVGDITRGAKELLVGGTTPLGPQEGVVNNPVSGMLAGAEDAPAAGELAESGAKKAADFITDRRAFAPNPETGHIVLDFDHVPGHQMTEPSVPTTKELVHVAPKDFIDKVNKGPIHADTVNHYREQIRSGQDVGPASITYDSNGNIVDANGRHRALAHMQEGTERMPVEIHRQIPEGTKPSVKDMQGPPVENAGIIQNARKILRDPAATEEDKAIATRQLEHQHETRFESEENKTSQQTVESAGGNYKGENKDGLVEITLPRKMTEHLPISDRFKDFVSVTIPKGKMTTDTVRAAMTKKFSDMGGDPTMLSKALAKD